MVLLSGGGLVVGRGEGDIWSLLPPRRPCRIPISNRRETGGQTDWAFFERGSTFSNPNLRLSVTPEVFLSGLLVCCIVEMIGEVLGLPKSTVSKILCCNGGSVGRRAQRWSTLPAFHAWRDFIRLLSFKLHLYLRGFSVDHLIDEGPELFLKSPIQVRMDRSRLLFFHKMRCT